MRVFEDQNFRRGSFADRGSAAVFENFEFRNCYFESYFFSLTYDPQLRSTFRNIRLLNCSQRGCTMYCGVLDNVIVDGLKTHGQLVLTHGAIFKHVVLRGAIDRLFLNNDPFPSISNPKPVREQIDVKFREVNAAFYRKIDWALDLRNAEFREIDIRGIPANLILRDAETQFVIDREVALTTKWEKLKFKTSLIPSWVQSWLEENQPDLVLVAPKRHKDFKNQLADLQLLRRECIALPE